MTTETKVEEKPVEAKTEPVKVKREPMKGLKALRAVSDKKPSFVCENCKCVRYSKCGCKKNQ